MKVSAPYRIVSKIYEEGEDYPVVVHLFYGKTLEGARKILQAHLKTDSFFRGCAEKKKFADFKCREERTSQRWDGRAWVSV